MCFDHSGAEWMATISEWTYERTDKPDKCEECGCDIGPGEWRCTIHQQEEEECQICEDTWSDRYDLQEDDSPPPPCEEGEHDYGETFDGALCVGCLKIRAAIYEVEEAEGCPEHSRQPIVGELEDVLLEDAKWGDGKYWRPALGKYPELLTHKIIGRIVSDHQPTE